MNEIFDKLLVRVLFSILIIISLLIYKYAHYIFYPRGRKQLFRKIYPSENPSDTLHLFSRIIGISIIFSSLEFNEFTAIGAGIFHFFVWSIFSLVLYLVSLYIMESIILYNFTYMDEILKKKNMTYAVVCLAIAVNLSFLIRLIISESNKSLIIMIILWLFALVMFGFATKLYQFVTKLSFNKLIIHNKIALGLSYSGYLVGVTTILCTAFINETHNIRSYIVGIILRVILGMILFPLFIKGIRFAFKIQDDLKKPDNPSIGYGIYEASLLTTSAIFAATIIGHVYFGTIYPFF